MENITSDSGDWKARTNKNVFRLALWTGAWVLTIALAVFGPEFLWKSGEGLTHLAILINLGAGVGMMVANIQHLKALDELMQKIQLEAMAFALGVGVVGGLSYSLMDTTNVIASDAEISYLVILIALTYLAATFIGTKRYR